MARALARLGSQEGSLEAVTSKARVREGGAFQGVETDVHSPGAQKRERLSKHRPKGDRGTSAFGLRHSPLFLWVASEKSPSTPSPSDGEGQRHFAGI